MSPRALEPKAPSLPFSSPAPPPSGLLAGLHIPNHFSGHPRGSPTCVSKSHSRPSLTTVPPTLLHSIFHHCIYLFLFVFTPPLERKFHKSRELILFMAVSLAQCLTHRRHMCVLKQSSSTHKVLDAGVTETIKVTLHSQEIYILTGLKKKKTTQVLVNTTDGAGFPSGSDSKESTSKAGHPGSIPGLGRHPGGQHGNPLHYSCLENPMDRGAWQDIVHRVTKNWKH